MRQDDRPPSSRWRLAASIVALAVLAIAAVLVIARPRGGAGPGGTADLGALQRQPHLSFLATGESDFGQITAVALADPAGPRAATGVVCQRQFSRAGVTSCLASDFGITTTYRARMLDRDFHEIASWPLPGAPSRTTISWDGRLVATTVFVAGDSYLDAGFSTRTVIRAVDGGEPNTGSLEGFSFRKDGRPYANRDINLWGVTFARDHRTFYVTVATGGAVYLARGDLDEQRIEVLRAQVECPSLSPDGSSIAYKYPLGEGRWRFHLLTLATGEDRELGETRSVDDQIQWLDDTTLMYGVPRPDAAPAVDVYALPTDGSAPSLLVGDASSPSVAAG